MDRLKDFILWRIIPQNFDGNYVGTRGVGMGIVLWRGRSIKSATVDETSCGKVIRIRMTVYRGILRR